MAAVELTWSEIVEAEFNRPKPSCNPSFIRAVNLLEEIGIEYPSAQCTSPPGPKLRSRIGQFVPSTLRFVT